MPFSQWSFGWDWKDVFGLKKKFPLGYPLSSWGEVRYANGDVDEGFVVDCYIEQAVDLYKWNDFSLSPFAGFRLTQSSEKKDYWNNKIGPWFGVKIKHPFKVSKRSWGEIDFGVRGEYYDYTSSAPKGDDFRVVFFLQWSFGGDWRKL